ncbi:hypothetical protein [Paenibacillus taichungensis]
MKLKWIENQNLFPFINAELLNDIIAFADGTKVVTLKFSKAYNLEYIGELAERWHERDIVKDNRDLLALVLAVAECSSGTFLYDQKKLFIKSVCEYLATNWNPIAAALILRYGRHELENVPELVLIRDMLGQTPDSFACESERILLISLVSDVYASLKPANEQIRNYVLELIDGMQLKFTDLHVEYPLLLLLSEVYGDLEKPTAKDLKTKGMSRLLQVIASLRTKEISKDNNLPACQALGVTRDDILVLNYYLAYQNTPRDHSITGPGFERIKENFIGCHFTSENDVPEQIITIVGEMIKNHEQKERSKDNPHPLNFLIGKFSVRGKQQFPNRNNLKLLVKMAEKILMYHVTECYMSLLEEGMVESKQRDQIIESLLTKHNLTKENFDYLEQQRLLLHLDITVTSSYAVSCLKHGHISLDQIDELENRGMLGFVIEHLKGKEAYSDLLDLLERVSDSYHKFLVEETSFNRLKSKMNDDLKKRLYRIYLSALYTHNASKYPERVFDMLKNAEFINLFGLSTDEVEELERNLYRSELLSESQAKSIREKYMTTEELEEVRTQELMKELNECSKYRIGSFVEKHCSKFKEKKLLGNTFVERLVHLLETVGKSDVGDMLLLFYQLRARNILTPEQVEVIEAVAIEKAEKLKIA